MKQKVKYFLILLFLATGCLNTIESSEVNIKVEFPFAASNVVLHIWSPYSKNISLEEMQNGVFTTEVPYTKELLFNISYDLPEFSMNNWWVASGNNYNGSLIPNRFDPHGIKYAKIWINGKPIDNSYLIINPAGDGLNIALEIKSGNSFSPLIDNTELSMKIDSRVPTEVHHRYRYKNASFPTPGDFDVAGWMNAVTGDTHSENCKIEVDYVRLYGSTGNNLILIAENEYAQFSVNDDGGLYYRYPYFPYGYDQHDPMTGKTDGNILTFYPSQKPEKVWHWWTPHFQASNGFQFESYRMVCRLRIQGNVVVQAGIDFKDYQNNTHELGCSDWYFENNGNWQEVVFDTQNN